jgi:hypothetical protein
LEEEYGEVILHCDMRWHFRQKVLQHFWQLKEFLEEKSELPEYRLVFKAKSGFLITVF